MKSRVFKIIEHPTADDLPSRVFAVFVMTLIVFNVFAVMLETVEEIGRPFARLFTLFEDFSVVVFTAEYVLRLWSCNSDPRYAGAVRGRLRYALSPLALIDLLAILPFYLEFLPVDLRFVRVLRLFRLLRIFKLARYSASLRVLDDVLRSRREELLVTLFIVVLLLVFSSSAMYYAENEAQPDKFSSIPSAMWWGVATLTTVGYGDVYPVTPLGRMMGAVIAVLGVGMFALPAGLLASGFAEELGKRRQAELQNSLQAELENSLPREPLVCPHCGRDPHEPPGGDGG
ncbi:MAG TPA: ion transporter [Pyrinomonadaceae bacterium]|nr:ion transporter [Pyrinomonadaceae bacterium]